MIIHGLRRPGTPLAAAHLGFLFSCCLKRKDEVQLVEEIILLQLSPTFPPHCSLQFWTRTSWLTGERISCTSSTWRLFLSCPSLLAFCLGDRCQSGVLFGVIHHSSCCFHFQLFVPADNLLPRKLGIQIPGADQSRPRHAGRKSPGLARQADCV